MRAESSPAMPAAQAPAPAEPMVRLDGVSKRFGDRLAVDGVSFALAKGAVPHHPRAERLRQDDGAAHDRGLHRAYQRRDRDPRPAGRGRSALCALDRHGVPAPGAVPAPERRRQRRLSVAHARLAQGRDILRGSSAIWSWCACPAWARGASTSCPAASSSGSRSPARWCSSPTSCCSTSRSRRSIASCARTCSWNSGASSRSSASPPSTSPTTSARRW